MGKALLTSLLCGVLFVGTSRADEAPQKEGDAAETAAPKQELFSGQVVYLPEALQRKGIKSYPENEKQLVLETDDGELIPIVSDWRGRAFYQDKRLRDRKVDLVGVRRDGVPYLQVLMIFVFSDKGERQYMDYWCDICAIPMYEIKPCDCCQGPSDLRLQPRGLPEYLTGKPEAKSGVVQRTIKQPAADEPIEVDR